MGNAVKFTPRGSIHVLAAPAAEGVVRFEVRDTGIGISQTKLQSIFEAFTQADGSHTRQFGGTGLGLAITRRLVNLMGGRVWAESEEGLGSRFFVELPLEGRPEPAQDAAGAVPDIPPLPHLRVLVAEDNPINQRVVCSMLRRQHWTVTLAANGREACERFQEGQYDLVLMDIQMPEMDGLEAARRMRAAVHGQTRPHTPIVALTAHASKAQHDQCLAVGMDTVITKPVDLRALLQCVGDVIGGQPAPSMA